MKKLILSKNINNDNNNSSIFLLSNIRLHFTIRNSFHDA